MNHLHATWRFFRLTKSQQTSNQNDLFPPTLDLAKLNMFYTILFTSILPLMNLPSRSESEKVELHETNCAPTTAAA